MSEYQLEGTIKLISDTQTFNSGFTKREFVVTDDGEKYPQDIKFECVKERCSWLDDYSQGDRVNVHFNIRGNEYNGRHYVNLQVWKLDKAGADDGAAAVGGGGAASSFDEPPPGHGQDATGDEIPF